VILYLDASALVKRYVEEDGSADVARWIKFAELVVTSPISRVEVGAAIARAGRLGMISPEGARLALRLFRREWEGFLCLSSDKVSVLRDTLAVEQGLGRFAALHLAHAIIWQESLKEAVTMASFDRQLWEAARRMQMNCLPDRQGGARGVLLF
jgi:predicted nucleic acid-binding protein